MLKYYIPVSETNTIPIIPLTAALYQETLSYNNCQVY